MESGSKPTSATDDSKVNFAPTPGYTDLGGLKFLETIYQHGICEHRTRKMGLPQVQERTYNSDDLFLGIFPLYTEKKN